VARRAGAKTDNAEVRRLVAEKTPLVLYGSYNERIYLAEIGGGGMMKTTFIPASFPAAHHPARAHGHAIPWAMPVRLTSSRSFATPCLMRCFTSCPWAPSWTASRPHRGRAASTETLAWEPQAHALLEELLEAQPVLVRISAAKQMRDRAERDARETGRAGVEAKRFAELFGHSPAGATA